MNEPRKSDFRGSLQNVTGLLNKDRTINNYKLPRTLVSTLDSTASY